MLNRREAISFVDHVKSQFEDDPDKYDTFLDIMRDLKGNVYVIVPFDIQVHLTDLLLWRISIGPSKVLLRIATLFNGHPDLALEFNTFLPPGYRLHPEGEGEESHISLSTPKDGGWPRDDVTVRRQRRSQ